MKSLAKFNRLLESLKTTMIPRLHELNESVSVYMCECMYMYVYAVRGICVLYRDARASESII